MHQIENKNVDFTTVAPAHIPNYIYQNVAQAHDSVVQVAASRPELILNEENEELDVEGLSKNFHNLAAKLQ